MKAVLVISIPCNAVAHNTHGGFGANCLERQEIEARRGRDPNPGLNPVREKQGPRATDLRRLCCQRKLGEFAASVEWNQYCALGRVHHMSMSMHCHIPSLPCPCADLDPKVGIAIPELQLRVAVVRNNRDDRLDPMVIEYALDGIPSAPIHGIAGVVQANYIARPHFMTSKTTKLRGSFGARATATRLAKCERNPKSCL